jgi:hypothetical protein
MKILVNENQFEKILQEENLLPNVIKEQAVADNAANDDNTSLIELENIINTLIKRKQKDILNKTTIQVTGRVPDIKLKIGQEFFPMMEVKPKEVYRLTVNPNTKLDFGGISLKALMPEIEKNPKYKSLVEKYPTLKTQVEEAMVSGMIYTDAQNPGTFQFSASRQPKDIKDNPKPKLTLSQPYPLGEFMEKNKLVYNLGQGANGIQMYGYLESGNLFIHLMEIDLTLPNAETTQTTAPQMIQLPELIDIFNFDSVDFKNPQVAEQQLGSFIKNIKENIRIYKTPFIQYFNSQNPTITGYASVDGNPEEQIQGKFQPCSANTKRSEYDLCISQQRAKKIADILNTSLPELGGSIKYIGKGETTEFGPGWTQENPTTPDKTANNRRFVLNPIKPFTVQQ